MKLTVDKEKLKNEISNALTKYEKDYVDLLVLYEKKVAQYLVYLSKQVKLAKAGTEISDLKPSPYKPSNVTGNLRKFRNGLILHTQDTIELTSDELDNITSGIERLNDEVTTSTISLNAMSY